MTQDAGRATVSEVFVLAKVDNPGPDPMTDKRFSITCPSCGEIQSLDQAPISRSNGVGMISEYHCKECGAELVSVGHWGFRGSHAEKAAYRLGDYAIYPEAHLHFGVASQTIIIPAT